MYSPQAVEFVVLLIDGLVTRCGVAKSTGFLQRALGRGLQGEESVVLVNFPWNVCRRRKIYLRNFNSLLEHNIGTFSIKNRSYITTLGQKELRFAYSNLCNNPKLQLIDFC